MIRAALVGVFLMGCSHFSQDPDPTPNIPISAVLPTFRLTWTDSSQLAVNFDSLVHDKSRPYRASFTQPTQGTLRLSGSTLLYTPTQIIWQRDSCTYTLCQGSTCGSGSIIFLNPDHTATCVQEPLIRHDVVSLGSFDVAIVPATSTGHLVEWNADFYTVDLLAGSNGKSLTYLAAGSGDTTNWGFDRITYRWEDGATCHEGVIEISIGDTCLPHARNFTAATAGTAFFPYDTLARHGIGCHNVVADGIFFLKDRQLQVNTKYGVASDTIIGSEHGLYYRRITPGVQPDSFDYFYMHTTDFSNRVTRATVTLSF